MKTVRIHLAALLAVLCLAPAYADAPDPVDGLSRSHGPAERLHERWLPEFSLDWKTTRGLAVRVVCGFGVVALALPECQSLAATAEIATPEGVLILDGGGSMTPDLGDIRRRSIEERMHSI